MRNVVGLTIFALGVVLLVLGFNETQSMASEVTRAFTGSPSDRSLWLVVGGLLSVVSGLTFALRASRQ